VKTRIALAAAVVLTVASILLLLRQQPQVHAQQPEVAGKWEYKVVTFSGTDKDMTKQLIALTSDRWEYVGLVAGPYYAPGGIAVRGGLALNHSGCVALRRPKK